MATRDDLYAALRNADAAGDTAAAQRLAQYIQVMPAQHYVDTDTYSPTAGMSMTDKLAAGFGKAFVDTGRGVKQLAVNAGNKVGLVSDQTAQQTNQDVNDAARRDQELMSTGAGRIGNVAGQAAQMAVGAGAIGKIPQVANALQAIANAGRVGALLPAAAGGAAFAGAQPVAEGQNRLVNMGVGGAAGAAGKVIGDAVASGVGAVKNALASYMSNSAAQNVGKDAAVAAARDAGFVVQPTTANPSALNNTLEGISGKVKTAQVASAKNQPLVNSMVKQALGLPEDQPITADALQAIRQQAGQAYEGVSKAGAMTADPAYHAALDKIVASTKSATNSFPGIAKNSIDDAIAPLRQDSFDAGDAVHAIRLLRDQADASFRQGEGGMGKALKGAADALEGVIGRNLESQGNTDALAAFQNARQLIAKTYTVQKALNSVTGDVNAQALASQLGKGKPLSGDLLQIAQSAQAFPKSFQSLKEAPGATSPLDLYAGVGGAAGMHNPLYALVAAARPAVRSAILSGPYQNALLQRSYSAPVSNALLDMANAGSRAAVPLAVPAGLAFSK